ncbi:hypothetical protein CIK05_05880 [Bdellovibrio sp. qaytius]|nr:hypothetical protein CIK05_05880 [Bdellovibrio sp. qaytius]
MILTFLSLTALVGTLPSYKSELLARTNGSSTYNMPAYSSMNNTSPSINDEGDVTFKILSGGFDQVGDHSEQSGLWLKTNKEIDGRVVYYAPKEKLVSDPKMLAHQEVLFSLFNEVSNDGLFIYENTNQKSHNVFAAKEIQALSYAQETGSDDSFAFRSTDSENSRSFFEWRSDKLWPVVDEEHGYAYLFGPSVNQHSQWLFKARLGERFNYAEEAPDQIVLLIPQFTAFGEKSYLKTVIAQDADSDALSPYKSFDNSPLLSNAGYAVFTATLKDKTRVIVAVKEGKHFIVAKENENSISQIEMFSPKINDNGLVVFRAKDKNGLRGIFLANPFSVHPEVKKLIAEGDSILADQGMFAILKRDQFPGFGGNVDINNNNEIVFSAVIATEDQKFIFGSVVYKLHPL